MVIIITKTRNAGKRPFRVIARGRSAPNQLLPPRPVNIGRVKLSPPPRPSPPPLKQQHVELLSPTNEKRRRSQHPHPQDPSPRLKISPGEAEPRGQEQLSPSSISTKNRAKCIDPADAVGQPGRNDGVVEIAPDTVELARGETVVGLGCG